MHKEDLMATAKGPQEEVVQFYASSKRIHPKLAKGRFSNWRIIAVVITQLVFYVVPWLQWNGRQAVLFDIAASKFYVFGITLLPSELIFLTGIMLVSAFGLFWWTTIAGRLWCGYACPQTVYTEIMLWFDHLFEGDRSKRLKLDKEGWTAHKIRIKTPKYLVILLFCFWTGFTFAGWFTPIRPQWFELFSFDLSNTQWFTIVFYGFATWFMAHIMREQVCFYMCPYARFQSAMFDKDTLLVSYDNERGEPRGARKKNQEATPLGDCVNCTLCVQVCPTGIDIRDGLQYQCIGCGACIDACDEVMDKIGSPRGLIRYTTEAALAHEYADKDIKKRLLRPRVLGYGLILFLVSCGLLYGIFSRDLMNIDIIKDRGVMVRQNNEGLLENTYNLRLSNASEKTLYVQTKVSGFDHIELTGLPETLEIKPGDIVNIPVQVATYPEYATKGSHPIEFSFSYHTEDKQEWRTINEDSNFIGE